MHSLSKQFVVGIALIAICQGAFAIRATNAPAPSTNNNATTGIIDRGGTLEAVNIGKKTITVNGMSYALSPASLTIHSASNKEPVKLESLKPGAKIRFRTSKTNFTGQEHASEIWIVDTGSAAVKK